MIESLIIFQILWHIKERSMKLPLSILSTLVSLVTNATNYYFSNAGSDQNSGTSKLSPYKSIAKLNSLVLLASDSVFFRGGDIFYGAVRIVRPGSSRRPIYFGSYNSTAGKPIITGLTTVSSWTSIGKGLFTTNVGPLSSCNMVILGNHFQAMSKLPRG